MIFARYFLIRQRKTEIVVDISDDIADMPLPDERISFRRPVLQRSADELAQQKHEIARTRQLLQQACVVCLEKQNQQIRYRRRTVQVHRRILGRQLARSEQRFGIVGGKVYPDIRPRVGGVGKVFILFVRIEQKHVAFGKLYRFSVCDQRSLSIENKVQRIGVVPLSAFVFLLRVAVFLPDFYDINREFFSIK